MFLLTVISHATPVPGEASIIQQLFAEGLDVFHLRKPDADEAAVRALIDAIPAVYHNRIAMHGFFHLMEEYDIHRRHFREEHRRQMVDPGVGLPSKGGSRLQELKEKGSILSTSVHDLPTLQQLSPHFSYTFFSPVFDSISKQGYKGVTGDGFYLHDEQKTVPVIALGGIDASNIQSAAAMNFDGAALLGAIWKDPANAVENYKKASRVQDRSL